MPQTQLSIGNMEILALHDHEAAMSLEALFPAVPAGDWAPYLRRTPRALSAAIVCGYTSNVTNGWRRPRGREPPNA